MTMNNASEQQTQILDLAQLDTATGGFPGRGLLKKAKHVAGVGASRLAHGGGKILEDAAIGGGIGAAGGPVAEVTGPIGLAAGTGFGLGYVLAGGK